MIFTTTKDDHVGPQHARKFAAKHGRAKMEELGKPFIYYELIEGGHGSGADLNVVIQDVHREQLPTDPPDRRPMAQAANTTAEAVVYNRVMLRVRIRFVAA